MRVPQAAVTAAALAVVACLGAGTPAAPALAETKAEATADCEAKIGLGLGSCKCFIDDWMAYGADTRALIAAVTKGDRAEEIRVRALISTPDANRATLFIATVSSKFRC